MSLKSSVKDLCPKVWVTAIKDAGRGLSPESPKGVRRFIWRPSSIWLVHSGHFLNESSFFLSLNQRLPQKVPRPWSPPIGIHLEPVIVLGFEIFLLVSRTLMTKKHLSTGLCRRELPHLGSCSPLQSLQAACLITAGRQLGGLLRSAEDSDSKWCSRAGTIHYDFRRLPINFPPETRENY